MVRTAFRLGGGKLDVLFRAGTATGGALVCNDAGSFHVRCKVASIVFVSLDTGEAVAAGSAKTRRDGREGQSEIDSGLAGSIDQILSPPDVDYS